MASLFQHITFRGDSRGRVKSLPGFLAHHRLPEVVNSTTTAFVRRAGASLVESQCLELFQQLRVAFGYKRRDLSVSHEHGLADVSTPDFEAHFRIDLASESPTEYVVTLEVDRISRESILHLPAFDEVFRGRFDRVLCAVDRPLAVEDVIDRVEDLESPDTVAVEYPPDASHCVVTLTGESTRLRFDADGATLLAKPGVAIAELLLAGKRLPGLLGLNPEASWF